MATIQVRNLTFTYPLADKPALQNIDLTIEQASFTVLCGKSGCGKSTFLRQLKKNMTPYGQRQGQVLYDGEEVEQLEDRLSVTEIGFVQQNPDHQLVTDKVWHELAFGLESLGLEQAAIRRRVAEMASFFDMQTWFRKGVAELSGGQKQLLNLASVMVMQPKVLILDEPTSQLDPIAAEEFLKVVHKINRELGTTVIISEHRLEDLFPMADRVVVMDEGKVIACDSPRRIAGFLAEGKQPHPMFYGLPSVMKIYAGCTAGSDAIEKGESPLTIREGRLWLEKVLGMPREGTLQQEDGLGPDQGLNQESSPIAISAKQVWFQYEKGAEPVLRDFHLQVRKGELFCLLGGNGVGKSTALKVIAGIRKPQRGEILVNSLKVNKENSKALLGKGLAMVPQNPQALFTEITVEEELLEALYYERAADQEKAQRVAEMLEMMEISHLRKSHPYDLSGGEQQRLALGKILLLKPGVLLLDEPTKGLDPFFKITLAGIFQKLKSQGVTILMVSHDIEFCAAYGDRCAMFFDGDVVSVDQSKAFFAGNSFYTTTANRMVRQWNRKLITWEEVCQWVEQVMTHNERKQ
ncbi:MAG: ATP-binding cassette domain-containing protein [Firmicutes bacterium]|nr:ATP-binding cassette domain-containing protein [Bacillota bacterium]